MSEEQSYYWPIAALKETLLAALEFESELRKAATVMNLSESQKRALISKAAASSSIYGSPTGYVNHILARWSAFADFDLDELLGT